MSKSSMSVDLKGKKALVTGGARGIGEAISIALASNGADVAINYRTSASRAKSLVREFQARGVRAIAIQADVSDSIAAEGLVRSAAEFFGSALDILVNNAGGNIELSPVEEMPVDLWDKVMALNVTSAMVCSRCVAVGMKTNKWGRIINISSIAARTGGGPGGGHYAASKAAMSSLTKTIAKELGPYGITANSIAPGVILTDIHREFNTPENLEQTKKEVPLRCLGQPEDVAGAVLFLASDSASYITGATITIDGGLRMD